MNRINVRKSTIVAILMIVIGASAFLGWEFYGREVILYQNVMVANVEIPKGTELKAKYFDTALVSRDLLIDGYYDGNILKEENKKILEQLQTKVAKQYIPKNSQINNKMITDKDFYIGEDESIYYVPKAWIEYMSTSVRRGDIVDIRTGNGAKSFGTYTVAFAKTDDETEVTDTGNASEELNRTEAEGIATHIEIICTLSEYKKLYTYTTGKDLSADATASSSINSKDDKSFNQLLIVQVF